MQLEAGLLVDTLKSIQEQLDHVEKATQRLAEGFEEYGYLKSIPGFGPYVSAMTLAAIGNPHRFENRAQLIRLAGFDLCASRSGEKSSTAVPVISKKGKADLRYALYQAALVASSLTPTSGSITTGSWKAASGRRHPHEDAGEIAAKMW